MATGGAGDVLAGVIAALIGQAPVSVEAAWLACSGTASQERLPETNRILWSACRRHSMST